MHYQINPNYPFDITFSLNPFLNLFLLAKDVIA